MERLIRPTLVIGIGAGGREIAQIVTQEAQQRLQGVPAFKALEVLESDTEALTSQPQLTETLDKLYDTALLQIARAKGWKIQRAAGVAVFILAPLSESAGQDTLLVFVDLLDKLSQRHPTQRLTLTPILLYDALPLDLEDTGSLIHQLSALPLTEAIYSVETVNQCGLRFSDDAKWEAMIAHWIIEMVSTPLGLKVAALPATGMARMGSLGMARWEFPAQALHTSLSQAFQLELLETLLAARQTENAPGLAVVWERSIPPALQAESSHPSNLAAQRAGWARPSLRTVSRLNLEIQSVGEASLAALEQAACLWDGAMEKAIGSTTATLAAESNRQLDLQPAGSIDAAATLLKEVEDAFRKASALARAASQHYAAQEAACREDLKRQGEALESVLTRFPPWSFAAWWQVLRRPWRWPAIFNRYRRITRDALKYADTYEALWLLTFQDLEAAWHAAYYQALAEETKVQHQEICTFRKALRACEVACRQKVVSLREPLSELLEAAALPPQLADHLYQRGYGDPLSILTPLLATSTPLSAWVTMEGGAEDLSQLLLESAREQFDFLPGIRLDTLLVHTYSGEELRARLGELLETAAPFWSNAPGAVRSHDGTALHHIWIGLPQAEDSQLVDLVPGRGIDYYSTGRSTTITAIQIAFDALDHRKNKEG